MDLTIPPCESTDPARSETASQAVDVRRLRHLRVVPELVVADGEADGSAERDGSTWTEPGLASVTYLPVFIPTEEEHEGEEDLPAPVAAVLPVPRL